VADLRICDIPESQRRCFTETARAFWSTRRRASEPDTIVRQHASAIQDATLEQLQIQPTTDLRKERHSGSQEDGMDIEAHLVDHPGLE
jgi:hypothetical protein